MKKIFPLLFLLVLSYNLFAQSRDSISFTEVVVTYQANSTTPIPFQNLYGKKLQYKSTGQEPSFLFSETPSIIVYSDAGSTQGYSYMRMRGIDQTRINITLDGMPLNEPEDQGAYFSNYPDILNSISKIQVQRGIGTSKNGTASYAGSIQLFSPSLYDSAQLSLMAGYGSFNSLRIAGEFNSGIKNKKALYIRSSQIYSDGYKYHSSNNSQSVFLSGGLFFEKSMVKLNVLAGQQKNQLAWLGVSDSLLAVDRRTNVNTDERDRFTQCLAQLQNSWQLTNSSSLQSSLYYTFLKGNYDFNLNTFLGLPATRELYNYAFQSNLGGAYINYSFIKNNFDWTTGVNANIYSRRHTGSNNLFGRLYQNTGYKNEFSAFTKAAYTYKTFTLFADVQYRYTSFSYRGAVPLHSLQWHFINPKAGISLRVNRNTVLYYNVGYAGREPTRNDIFMGNDDLPADSSGTAITGITKPEYVLDQELGIRYHRERITLEFNLYCLNFKNEIVLDGKFGPNGLALTNDVDQSIRTGCELHFDCAPAKGLFLSNNSSFNYSHIKEENISFKPILTPLFIINQEAAYNYKSFTIAVTGRYQYRSFIDFANTASINGYFLLNCRAQYEIRHILLSLFVNNITNTQYYNNGYVETDGTRKYFVQAPVNFYIAAKYTF